MDTTGASPGSTDSFLQCATGGGGSGGGTSSATSKEHSIAGGNSSGGSGMGAFLPAGQQPNYVIIITALVCIIGLMLPISDPASCGSKSEGHAGSSPGQTIASLIPSYLHVTVNQKLLAAYALGLVTMVIFRP